MSHKSCKSSADLGKFKIPRKTGPSQERHCSHKSDWKPPKFMKNVISEIQEAYDNETNSIEWLNEKHTTRGKFQSKTNYRYKSKSLPQSHIKSKTHMYNYSKDLTLESILKEMSEETAEIEDTMQDWKQWKKNYDQNSYGKLPISHSSTPYSPHTNSNLYAQLKQQLAAETQAQKQQIQKADLKHKQLQSKKQKSLRRLKTKRKPKKDNKRREKQYALRAKQKKSKQNRQGILGMEEIAKQKAYKLLDNFRKQQAEDEERELLFKQINIGAMENERLKVERINAKEKANKKWNGYYGDTRILSPRTRRKKKKPKARRRDYRIFYSVNIETYEKHKYAINNNNKLDLKYLLAQLFDIESEKNVFEIKTRKKANGFKMDFGIIIATCMHPSDYIDTFEDLLQDESFHDVVMEGFNLDECPTVKIWEARYQKFVVKKQRKRRTFF